MPLLLIATPIGNLRDLSQRALDSLRSSDLILCEDTRTSAILLRHYGIERPLLAFHKFNEQQLQEMILERLEQQQTLSLISDAGTPCLCDPGAELVAACRARGIAVIPIPGPCAPIAALIASGLSCVPFQFLGFAPKTPAQLQRFCEQLLSYRGTSLFFESPHRLSKTLAVIGKIDSKRRIALAKEISKRFETFWLDSCSQLQAQLSESNAKGEWVVMVEHSSAPSVSIELVEALEKARALERKGLSRRDSVSAVALCLGCDPQELYRHLELAAHNLP